MDSSSNFQEFHNLYPCTIHIFIFCESFTKNKEFARIGNKQAEYNRSEKYSKNKPKREVNQRELQLKIIWRTSWIAADKNQARTVRPFSYHPIGSNRIPLFLDTIGME
jgi:hypothetical protein